MSASLSVLAKVRDAMLALGRSERAAVRKARLLSSASFSDFVRLTPQQNGKFGLSPKARHYVLKGARITKATPTISARQFETKRASELFGLTPERATQARRHDAISYVQPTSVSASPKLRLPAKRIKSSQPSRRCGRLARLCRATRQTGGGTEVGIQCPNTRSAGIAL
jgi:hypothetical protein